MDKAKLHEPNFSGNERKYLLECLESNFVSTVGKHVKRFEDDLANFTGAKHVVAVVNGTEALHVALLLAGVQEGDEILIPSLTFVGTANAVKYCGAIPHFVDSDGNTLGLDPKALRDWLKVSTEVRSGICFNRNTGRRISTMVPVHIFGHPCDLEGLINVGNDFGITIVEDAAESLGSSFNGRHTGTYGLLGTLSFNGNKIITTGGGGAILTNDIGLERHARHLTTTAKIQHPWEYIHDEIGFNHRMPSINAALGCAQLEQLPNLLDSKRRLFKRYRDSFKKVGQVKVFEEPEGCSSNYWLQAILLEESVAKLRDNILKATNNAGQMTRPVWNLIHTLAPYRECPSAPLPVAESLASRLINLPSSAGLV
jgi:aminotransferase in exopolysaccharide biosynthesis